MTGHPLTPDTTTLHGTCVAIGGVGVLLLGPPGAGKSDLALRLIDGLGHGISGELKTSALVSDDQVTVVRRNGGLLASPPATIAGKMEIRGQGIVELPHMSAVQLRLVVRLSPFTELPERMPEEASRRHGILGISLPWIMIDPASPSAAARIRAAVDLLPSP